MVSLVLLLLVCMATNSLTHANGDYSEKRLTNFLLDNYSRIGVNGRPVSNQSQALEVKFGISLQNILKVDPEEQTITTLLWYNLEWKDELLKWRTSDYDGVDSIRVRPDSIFIPDIIPYNGVPGSQMTRTDVVVHPDGVCAWVPTVTLTTTCGMEDDPMDINCPLKFGSWTFDGSKLNLTNMMTVADTATYKMHPKWNLHAADAKRTVMIYECCPEPYIDITYTLHLVHRNLAQNDGNDD